MIFVAWELEAQIKFKSFENITIFKPMIFPVITFERILSLNLFLSENSKRTRRKEVYFRIALSFKD